MARSSRNRRSRRKPIRASAIVRRALHSDIGVQISPGIDPPPWASAPWWPITITSIATKAVSYTWELLNATLLSSLKLVDLKSPDGKQIQFNLRVNMVRIWALDNKPITMDIFANSGATCHKIRQLNDMGSSTRYPRLGWRFGKSSFAMLDVGCPTSQQSVFAVGGPSTKILCYIQMLIQLEGVPNVTQTLEDVIGSALEGANSSPSSWVIPGISMLTG